MIPAFFLFFAVEYSFLFVMNRINKHTFALASAFLLISGFTAGAQELKTAFLLDDFLFSYRINPALQMKNTDNFVGLFMDNVTLSANTNVGLSSYLFPFEGELLTGLNSKIPAETFLKGLPSVINVTGGLNYNIFAAGKKSKDGRSVITAEVNMRNTLALSMPKSLFEYLKSGDDDNTYYFRDAFLRSKNYFEICGAYSRNFDKLTVGASLKVLFGFAEADAKIEEMSIVSEKGAVTITGIGDLTIAAPTITLITKNGHYNYKINKNMIKFSGYGAALDLGVSYQLTDDLLLSASVIDLGGIQWINSQYGIMNGSRTSSGTEVIKSMKEVCQYKEAPLEDEKTFHMVDGSINLGARMSFPSVPGLLAGATASYRFGDTRIADFRIGASYKTNNIASFATSAGLTSFGPVLGAMANFNFKGMAFYMGMDGLIFEITPQSLPVRKVNTSFKLGLAIRR